MDFNSILQACYKKGITPFALYSNMLDLCRGDLELKEQASVLYNLYKQRDIFGEISLCKEEAFGIFLEQYSPKERDCLKKCCKADSSRVSCFLKTVQFESVISKLQGITC